MNLGNEPGHELPHGGLFQRGCLLQSHAAGAIHRLAKKSGEEAELSPFAVGKGVEFCGEGGQRAGYAATATNRFDEQRLDAARIVPGIPVAVRLPRQAIFARGQPIQNLEPKALVIRVGERAGPPVELVVVGKQPNARACAADQLFGKLRDALQRDVEIHLPGFNGALSLHEHPERLGIRSAARKLPLKLLQKGGCRQELLKRRAIEGVSPDHWKASPKKLNRVQTSRREILARLRYYLDCAGADCRCPRTVRTGCVFVSGMTCNGGRFRGARYGTAWGAWYRGFLCSLYMAIRQITIIGTGLIGGSVGLAFKANGFGGRIVGCDRVSVLERAKSKGAIDTGFSNPTDAVHGSNVVILATAVGGII